MAEIAPWELKPALTESRLNSIAQAFLDIYYGVEETLNTEDDDNYTRGATFFGRSRQRLIRMSQSGEYPWLALTNSAMDVTLEIDGVPFRFFRDDHASPSKKGFWRRNESDQLFAPDETTPVIFRFIVERPLIDDADPEIYFVGFNAQAIQVFEWRYGQVPIVRSIDETLPQAVEQGPAPVEIKKPDAGAKEATK
ncbi:MAG: hypothetical protein A3H93_06380 [Rhodocyclales bacterium RIFCSPLOWO2_02_FULL_63_24]|nr:MAG: hypothetical protein A3H93_06380 [Rhodocyclales bacterium RIFCSPLOWO2_02_FULL_63_24]